MNNTLKILKRYYSRILKRTNRSFRTIFYAGDTVYCKICRWKGKKFFNRKCPKCNSVPRTRLVPFSLGFFNLIKKNLQILHIAPNVNEYRYIKNYVDSLKQYDRLDIKQRKHTNIKGSITDTKLLSNTYDLIIAWHVLEHIPEDIKAIKEAYRLLKKGGHFLVSIPVYPINNPETFEDISIPYEDYTKMYGHYDHCRSCGLDYYKRFEDCGFITQELKVKDLAQDVINLHDFKEDHIVWCFTK